ncbi:hypothetical protein D3C80_1468440 [compost metagenome]
MHALAFQGIEVHRQGAHQGLALAGTHLGDLALVQGHAADQLDVEVAHAHHPLAGLAGHGKGFRQQLVEGFALGQARLELFGLAPELLVAQRDHLLFQGVDRLDSLGHALDFTLVLASKEFLQQRRKHIGRVFHLWKWRALPGSAQCRRRGSEEGILPGNAGEKRRLIHHCWHVRHRWPD